MPRAGSALRCGAGAGLERRMAALLVVCCAAVAAVGQLPSEDPLLPGDVSTQDVELSGRFARHWKQADGTLTIVFTGDFQLDFGQRRFTADEAVVWVYPQTQVAGQTVFELLLYLSGDAVVREPGGSVTEDQTLLVTDIRTSGRLIKSHDAHTAESMESSELYQRAAADRARYELGQFPGVASAAEPATQPADPNRPPSRRVIRFDLQIEPAQTPSGERVFVSTGRAYLMQTSGPDEPVIEIQADNAVIFPAERLGALPGLAGVASAPASAPVGQPASAAEPPGERPRGAAGPLPLADASGFSDRIRAAYLEGDVVLTAGDRLIRADRVYYDFERNRALILDAVFRADLPDRGIPLYVRADEIRQLSSSEFAARNARVSTSEFYTPHYHVGADRVIVRQLQANPAQPQQDATVSGEYEMFDTTLNVRGVPLLSWPYARGDFQTSETLLRRFSTGYSDDRGVEFETAWYLFNLLGLPTPPGFDGTLRLDYYTRRGPAIGVDTDYQREDYLGLLRSYFINDSGEDNLGPVRDNTPSTPNRGRFTWRHRHFLEEDWQLSLELSYLSDPAYLEEYERSEFNEGKQQETLVYLKRARDTEAISLLAKWRILEFTTQTESLPDVVYRRIGDPLGDWLVSYSEVRGGLVRYRPDERRFFDELRLDNTRPSDVTARADARQEFEAPLKLGAVNVVPFASLRGSYWDWQPRDDGGLWRGQGVYGARGGTTFSRTYEDIRSELLDIDRLRHVISPYAAGWWSHSNTRSGLIAPYEFGVETIDDFYGTLLGVRQVWQTKRGAGDKRRTVDLLTLTLEAGFFGKTPPGDASPGYASLIRPENSRPQDYAAGELIYRLSDTTSVLYDFNFDLSNQGFDRHNVSIAVERLPRLAYLVGWRQANDIDMNLIGGGFNYKLNEKHILTSRAYWDIDESELGELAVGVVRRVPRWYVGTNFEFDGVFEEIKFSVSLWPEGVPEWTLGSRRFSGLGTSTGIRP